jgi:acyl-CoA thioester hydrolase
VPVFKFTTPVAVRYADIDVQGHVNHARYFTFMEEGRMRHVQALGLWTDSRDCNAIGQIVAEATGTYQQPVFLGQTVDVAVRVARLGAKSLDLDYRLTVVGQEVARGRTVQVAYDYAARGSIPIPAAWRQAIAAFEPDLS